MSTIAKLFFLSAFFVFCATSLSAGAYELWVCNEPEKYSSCLGTLASRNSEIFPLRNSEEIAADIKKYFSGQQPTLKWFAGFFKNGHVHICGVEARNQINLTFIEILKQEKIVHVRELFDQLMMLGGNSLVSMIDNELKNSSLSEAQSKSLLGGKEVVVIGINSRNRN